MTTSTKPYARIGDQVLFDARADVDLEPGGEVLSSFRGVFDGLE